MGLIAVACLPISRFYNEHFGRVTLSSRQQVRAAVAALTAAPVVFGVSLLSRSRASWSLDLPVNATAASFAVLMLASHTASVGLRKHHAIIFGTLLLVGIAPVWTGADPSNIGLVLAGVATIATGIFDHLLLVRTFGPPKLVNPAEG